MIQGIKQGILDKLYALYGDEKSYLYDEQEQGFMPGSFWVIETSGAQEQVVGQRYLRTEHIDVRYYGTEAGGTAELHGIADALTDALKYVTEDEGLVRGENMNYQIEDGVLHFFVDYRVHLWKQKERVPYMETLEQVQHLKEG